MFSVVPQFNQRSTVLLTVEVFLLDIVNSSDYVLPFDLQRVFFPILHSKLTLGVPNSLMPKRVVPILYKILIHHISSLGSIESLLLKI